MLRNFLTNIKLKEFDIIQLISSSWIKVTFDMYQTKVFNSYPSLKKKFPRDNLKNVKKVFVDKHKLKEC